MLTARQSNWIISSIVEVSAIEGENIAVMVSRVQTKQYSDILLIIYYYCIEHEEAPAMWRHNCNPRHCQLLLGCKDYARVRTARSSSNSWSTANISSWTVGMVLWRYKLDQLQNSLSWTYMMSFFTDSWRRYMMVLLIMCVLINQQSSMVSFQSSSQRPR